MKSLKFLVVLMIVAMLAVACGGAAEPAAAPVAPAPAATEVPAAVAPAATEAPAGSDISGEITVLTNRTDLVDTTFVEYAKKFNEKYPNVKVNFEAMTDYTGEVKIRMNTEDYGDVLLIPDEVNITQLPDFFAPLGTVDELGQKYNFVTEKALQGQVYGLPVTGNANGVLYNKAVFEAAGITELPNTPEAFLAALQLVKDKTDAIPYYTNYAAGWPLQWQSYLGSVSCDPDASNKMVQMDAPFAPGTPNYIIYKLMYDMVAQGLNETDPSTTDWELSKQMFADGEIATLPLGSWAIVQMEEKAADPSVVGYMPFPSNVDGKVCATAGGDYKIAINKNTESPEAARAWLDWFLDESNFAYDQGGIPPLKDGEYPPQLASFAELGVELVSANPAPAGEEGWFNQIDTEAEIGLNTPNLGQRIIDAARGNTDETFDDIMNDLNAKWAEAHAGVVNQ